MGFAPSNFVEGQIIGKNVAQTMPGAKIAVLYQNDDLGKDFLRGAKETLGTKATIVGEVSYEVSDPTVDSQIVTLQSSGATVLFAFATQKATAQAIRHAGRDWLEAEDLRPVDRELDQPGAAARGAGQFQGGHDHDLIAKDPTSPRWADDQGAKDFIEWVKKYDTLVDVRTVSRRQAAIWPGMLL